MCFYSKHHFFSEQDVLSSSRLPPPPRPNSITVCVRGANKELLRLRQLCAREEKGGGSQLGKRRKRCQHTQLENREDHCGHHSTKLDPRRPFRQIWRRDSEIKVCRERYGKERKSCSEQGKHTNNWSKHSILLVVLNNSRRLLCQSAVN